MIGDRASRWLPAWAGLAGFLLFAGTAANGFVFDDLLIVTGNDLARDPSNLGGIFTSHYWAGIQPGGNLYRPLAILSFAINHALAGPGPAGYHLANALLHGGVAALLVALAAGLGLGRGAALAAGLIFAAHPVHTEAVASVVGRSELLAALFALAAWLAYLAGTPTREAGKGRTGRAARAGWGALSLLLFAAALLSKESAAILPALIGLGEWWRLREERSPRGWTAALPGLAGMALVLLAWFLGRQAVLGGLPVNPNLDQAFAGVAPGIRILTAVAVLGSYLKLLLLPVTLSADYSYNQIPLVETPLDPGFLIGLASYLVIMLVGLWLARAGRLSGFGILFYLVAILPVSNILFSIGTVLGERLLYVPSIGFCLALPALWSEWRGRAGPTRGARIAGVILLVLLCGLYGARTLARNADWKDQLTLFRATVIDSPGSARAHYNLGLAEEAAGNRAAAMEGYRRAVAIKPDQAEPHRSLGLALLAEGRALEGLASLRAAADRDPGIPDLFNDVGVALHRLGRLDEAAAAFQEESRRRPGGWLPHYNLGLVRLDQGRPLEALRAFDAAAERGPRDPDIPSKRGLTLVRLGRPGEAAEAHRLALEMDPRRGPDWIGLARAELAGGREGAARRAAREASRLGIRLPADLAALLP